MSIQGRKVILHDMCLRDGMHPKRHQISLDEMRSIGRALDEAGVPLIEVTHGDGLGGRSINYGFPCNSDEEYLKAVVGVVKNAKVSALLLRVVVGDDEIHLGAIVFVVVLLQIDARAIIAAGIE